MASLLSPQRIPKSTGAPTIHVWTIPHRDQSHQQTAVAASSAMNHSPANSQALGSL